MTLIRVLVAGVLLAAPFCVAAQSLKPGLWEIENRMQGGGARMDQGMAQMQQELANMPPEQRKMLQDMMAKQGMSMDAGAMRGTSVRVCMTKDMAARNEIPAQQEGNCKQASSSRSGNTMKITLSCSNPPSSGEGTVTILSPESYRVQMTVQATVQGRSENVSMEGSGKWLSADCGGIKAQPGR